MADRPVADLGGFAVGAGRVCLLGAINVSAGSFYGGSVATGRRTVAARARAIVRSGADVVDLGARSTAPYLADSVTDEEESALLALAVAGCRGPGVPISADTSRPGPAAAALEAGATILNDITGLADPATAEIAAARGASAILMAHPLGQPFPADPLGVVRSRLEQAMRRAEAAGIPSSRIVLDPGIGFFRSDVMPWHAWDAAVLRGLASLLDLGRPLLVGASRKSFIGHLLNQPSPAQRLAGSLAAAAIAVRNGADAIRTHDVRTTRDAVDLALALR